MVCGILQVISLIYMLSLMLIGKVVLMIGRVLVEQHFFLGGCLVGWSSKKQSTMSLSTPEAEYIATATCCTQVLWMKQMLKDIHIHYNEPIPIFCDNTSAINISKNPIMYSKTKHIPIKFHFLREQVMSKVIKVEYVGTKDHIVDVFTKPLSKMQFESLRDQLGVYPL